jgi:myo-inositol 2-dehydrogenase / D-chiro-inositol 1-dehydrogenase
MKSPNQPDSESQLNRRNFLKTTSTAIVGGSLLGGLGIERSAFAAGGDDVLKIALIGCGGRGTGAADQTLRAAGKNVKLIAMADISKAHLNNSLNSIKESAAKDKHEDLIDVPEDQQFVGWDGYKKAIALADVVVLATPPGIRPIHLEEAVNAGKHIFSEKPLATDAPGVRKVLAAAELAKQKNLKVAVGLQRHHHPAYVETIKRIHDGEIGDVISMRCYWNGTRPWQHPRKPGMSEMQYQMDNWYYFTWICGDHIVEQHIHNLDVCNWIKQGHPIRASGMGGCQMPRISDDGEIFDHHAVEFEYADGTRMYSQCRHQKDTWQSVAEHAAGTLGTADLEDGRNFDIKGKNSFHRTGHGINAWQEEHFPFWDAIRNDKPYNELEYGAHSTMTAIMGRMATYSGNIISWDQAINSKVELGPDNYSWDGKPQPTVGANGLYPMAMPGDAEWFKKIV